MMFCSGLDYLKFYFADEDVLASVVDDACEFLESFEVFDLLQDFFVGDLEARRKVFESDDFPELGKLRAP